VKFLLYSTAGEGAQILKRIELEGNEVGIFIKDKIYSTVFDGLLPKVEPEKFIDKDTIIIFDMSGNGAYADSLKRKGHLVYGGSSFADDLEHDRAFGFDAMKQAGIKIPDSKEFKDWKEACSFIEQHKKRLVFKPTGSNLPCKLTYVSKDSKELITYLHFVEKHFAKDIESFILQDFIEGEVVSSECFCDGTKFLYPGNHTVEVKKSMNDDLGASTGCSGNVTWADDSNIMAHGIEKIQSLCVKHSYVGQIDLNAVVNETGVYGLEWTPRFGYDATPTFMELFYEDIGKFYSDIVRGQCDIVPCNAEYAGSVRVTIPPYPAEPKSGVNPEKFSPSIGVPILDWEEIQDSLYFYEVQCDEGQLVHSGGVGVIACSIGIGENPKSCMEDAYIPAEKIQIPDKQYRTDLCDILPEMVRKVEEYA
jgi:phosphoribosylamine---glycine ligase